MTLELSFIDVLLLVILIYVFIVIYAVVGQLLHDNQSTLKLEIIDST